MVEHTTENRSVDSSILSLATTFITNASRRVHWIAAAIIVLGAFLRLHDLTAMEFKQDQQEALNLGLRLLAQHPWSSSAPWPAQGMISSNGVPNAPLFSWIMAGGWALGRDPVAVARGIAFVNALCLVPLWLWARRRMDDIRAIVVLALCAVSPFAVMYSRTLWAQDLLLPGVIAVLWGIEWLGRGRPWRGLMLLGLAALLMGQLHQSGAIAIALLPIAWVLQILIDRARRAYTRWPLPTPAQILGVIVVGAVNLFFWMPYLRSLAALPPEIWANRPKDIMRPLLLGRVAAQVVPSDLFFFFQPDRAEFMNDALRSTLYGAAFALGVPLLIYGVWRWLRAPSSLPVLGVWWWSIIAFFTFARIPCYPFYVLTLAPLPAALAGGAFDPPSPSAWIARLLPPWRLMYAASMLGLTITTQSWLADRGGSQGDFGVVYARREAQARRAVSRLAAWGLERPPELGERSGQDGLLSCQAFPVELRWLVFWLEPGSVYTIQSLSLCDGWIEEGGRRVYRWTIH